MYISNTRDLRISIFQISYCNYVSIVSSGVAYVLFVRHHLNTASFVDGTFRLHIYIHNLTERESSPYMVVVVLNAV